MVWLDRERHRQFGRVAAEAEHGIGDEAGQFDAAVEQLICRFHADLQRLRSHWPDRAIYIGQIDLTDRAIIQRPEQGCREIGRLAGNTCR